MNDRTIESKFCNLCGGNELRLAIDFGSHPISKHYLNSQFEKKPLWPVKLYYCESCGLTQLKESCPPEVIYDNYVTLSAWKPQPQVDHEINMLEQLSSLSFESKIIEIGCNDAMFLDDLSKRGYKNLTGIEPSGDAAGIAKSKGYKVVEDFLTPELSSELVQKNGKYDLFISRQNLEHISDLKGVISSLNILIRSGGYVLIEVPNFGCNLLENDYGLWEEHVNYFTVETLRLFLAKANIKVLHEEIFLFSGEGIFVLGKKVESVPGEMDYLPDLSLRNKRYSKNWPRFKSQINEFLQGHIARGKKIAIYGAGARSFCLINFTDIGKHIEVIVDDQKEKQEKFMPGTGIPIKSSESLYQNIDICLLAVNTENEKKVLEKHKQWVKDGGIFWSIFPPSSMLVPVKID
jgi:2-polyprenyl-3-methyl-5-hydroxy-6-metoxy-1,4-benzoquinol methylase/flavodoxin